MGPVILAWLIACQPETEDTQPAGWLDRPEDSDPVVDSEPVRDSEPDKDSDPPPVPLELCINEFMPSNKTALVDDVGAYSDWIELHNPGDEYLLLEGWTLTDEVDDDSPHVIGGELVLPPGEFMLFYADGQPELGAHHLSFKLSDSEAVILHAPDGRGSVVHYGLVEPDFSAARTGDCCEGGSCWDFRFRGSPGSSNEQPTDLPLIERGSTWRYFDAGQPPDGWQQDGFYDEGWASGAGPLGFGDAHIVTVIDGGPEGARTPTLYFRQTFELGVGADKIDEVLVELLVDDGALIWLNGEELSRKNLSGADISHDSWAKEAVAESSESAYSTISLPSDLFREGENLLAVEVHQAAATSSDLGFDLALTLSVWP